MKRTILLVIKIIEYIKYNSILDTLINLLLLGVQNIVKELSIIIMINIEMISVKMDLLLDSNLTLLILQYTLGFFWKNILLKLLA